MNPPVPPGTGGKDEQGAPPSAEPFFVAQIQPISRRRNRHGRSRSFLDAGYLIKVIQADHDRARIDLAKLSQEMAAPDQLLRAYYYNCMPYQGTNPTE